MVVFTCEACNESLKKNKVEAHLFRCRRAKHVTCIDCQADFDRESYKEHTSCISEIEKYSGPGYVAKASANKGAKKQDDWFQRVQSAIDRCAKLGGNQQQLTGVLNKVRESSNVPRKQAKFVNFCRNSMKWASPAVIQQAWNLLSEAAAPAAPKAEVKPAEEAAGQTEAVQTEKEKHKKSKKRRIDDEENGRSEEPVTPTEADDEQQKSEKKHKKKRKVEENCEAEKEAADQQAEIDLQAEADQQDNEIDQLVEKKMKKKKRSKKEYCQGDVDEAVAEAAEANGDSGEKRKHKKRRRRQDDGSEAAELSVA